MSSDFTAEERAILRELVRVPEVRGRLNVTDTIGISHRLIALILGLSKSRVQQIEQIALNKIRKKIKL